MVVTFVIDTPAVLALGLVMSWLPPDRRDETPFWRLWPFLPGLAATVLAFATAVASHAVAPDWMFMYFLPDSRCTVAGFAYLGLLLYAVPYVAAFQAGRDLRRWSRLLSVVTLFAIVAAQVLVVASLFPRYWRVGSRAEWLAGGGVPLPEHVPLGRVSALGGAAIVLVLVLTIGSGIVRRRRSRIDPGRRWLPGGAESVVAALAARFFPHDPAAATLAPELSRYVGGMSLPNRAGLELLLFGCQWLPPVLGSGLRRFTALPPQAADAYLAALEHHRLPQLRLLFLVPKTLLCLLYYERPEVLAAIGASFHCRQANRPPAFPETPRVRA